jgi:hypothetical protein
VALVIVLVLVALMIVGLVLGGAREQDLSTQRLGTVRALYAAEAGINMGMREWVLRTDADGDGAMGSISDDGNAANNPALGGGTVWVDAVGGGLQTTLISHGSAGLTSRRLESIAATPHSGQGLLASYFELGAAPATLADVPWSSAANYTGIVSNLDLASTNGQGWPNGPTNNWGKRFTGSIRIPTSGSWTFYTNSDDGSKLWIDGSLVVSNDGLHAMQLRSGTASLTAGLHTIEVQWFERTGNFGLIVSWSGPGVPSQTVIPASALSH